MKVELAGTHQNTLWTPFLRMRTVLKQGPLIFGDGLTISPPLVITAEDADRVIEMVDGAIGDVVATLREA